MPTHLQFNSRLWNFSSRRNQRINWDTGERKYYHNQAAIGRRNVRFTRGYDFQSSSSCLKGSKRQSLLTVIRTEELPEAGINILRKMKELNPNGKLVFMHEGRPLLQIRLTGV